MSESDILIDRVSDYFSEFKPIIDKWRTRIYRMESNLDGAIVHDHIFQMLGKFISKLNNETPTPLPSPVAPPVLPPVLPLVLPLVPQVVPVLPPQQGLRSVVH
jgi:hypothetical protein